MFNWFTEESVKIVDDSMFEDVTKDKYTNSSIMKSISKNFKSVPKQSKSRIDYVKWSVEELDAIKRSLGKFIALNKIPQQHDCLLAIKNEPILKNRPWKKVKYQVANLIKKSLK